MQVDDTVLKYQMDGGGVSYCRSRHIAIPIPPPTQSAATPRFPPVRSRPYNRDTTTRQPEAPMGWPSAMEPPETLTLAISRPKSREHAIEEAAKASLSSNKSTSAAVHDAFLSCQTKKQ